MYSSIICGASWVLFLLTVLWMKSAKKWFRHQRKILDKKKKELDNMINSATDMVHELNNVSDYVANLIGTRTEELNETVRTVDEKLEECRKMFEQQEIKENIVEFPSKTINSNVTVSHHSRKSEIEDLYNGGYSISEIARELNVGKGEIELMLGINERFLRLAN